MQPASESREHRTAECGAGIVAPVLPLAIADPMLGPAAV